MARTAVRLVFAAVLALLTTQVAMPSVRVVAAFELAWRAETHQTEAEVEPENIRVRASARVQPPALTYVPFLQSEPDSILRFQLPPPVA